MARRSAASLSVVPRVDGKPTRVRPRADVPSSLKEIINELIRSVPAEHFRSGDGVLLELYAQTILMARVAQADLEKNGYVVNGRASPWIAVLEKAHRSATALAARLRLAPQMRLSPKTVGRQPGPPPSYYDIMRSERDDDGAA